MSDRRLVIPLCLIGLGAALAILAPAERTLGDGIRWVYVHVSLVWAGSAALAVAGLLGTAALVSGSAGVSAWTRAVWHAGLVVFALGIAFSLVAARVNWGAVFLAEPRMVAALRILAMAVILAVLDSWLARPRLTGALALLTAGLLAWQIGGAQLVMHPRDPIRQASAVGIQATFAIGFLIGAALTVSAALALHGRSASARPSMAADL